MTAPDDFVSREELLAGLPARRASITLFAIEGRTAQLVDRSRRSMEIGLTDRTAAAREREFLEALAVGGELRVQPTIQDLECYAPAWASLVPPEPAARAAILHALGNRYRFTKRSVPALRAALGAGEPAVERAYARAYGRPLATGYARKLPWRERVRWRRAAAARRLEALPAAWLAFALTLTETVGGGMLALPIALATIGPLGGLALVVALGVVNLATIGALVEAVTRDGDIRYGSTFFGRLAHGHLGRAAAAALTPVLLVQLLLVLVSFYIGVATTLADVTPVPATVWAVIVFAAGMALLRRETLNATVATALVVGAVNITLILTIAVLALASVEAENLRHVGVPLLNGGSFDVSTLSLAFGVVLACYFGHTSAGNAAKVVLHREPSGRALLVGNAWAFLVAIALYGLFVVIVNGAVAPAALADAPGTSLQPLAQVAGASINVVGTVFVVLAMGMTTVHMALGISNQVREWMPEATRSAAPRVGHGRLRAFAGAHGFWLSMTPVVATLLLVEWLLATNRSSFAAPLNFLGTLTMPLVGGIFPMLMLVASRRKGEYVPAVVVRLLGHPVVVVVVLLVYFAALLAYGILDLGVTDRARSGAARCRGDDRPVGAVRPARRLRPTRVRRGARRGARPRPRDCRSRPSRARTVDQRPEIVFDGGNTFADLSSVTIELPESRAEALKLRVHRVTTARESEPLTAAVEVQRATDRRTFDLDGLALIPINGAATRVHLSFRR